MIPAEVLIYMCQFCDIDTRLCLLRIGIDGIGRVAIPDIALTFQRPFIQTDGDKGYAFFYASDTAMRVIVTVNMDIPDVDVEALQKAGWMWAFAQNHGAV